MNCVLTMYLLCACELWQSIAFVFSFDTCLIYSLTVHSHAFDSSKSQRALLFCHSSLAKSKHAGIKVTKTASWLIKDLAEHFIIFLASNQCKSPAYTAKLLIYQSLRCTVTTWWLEWTVMVWSTLLTASSMTAIGSSVTLMAAVNNSDYTVTVQVTM